MWFRNLLFYRLREPVAYDPEAAEQRLANLHFTPCGAFEAQRSGFVPPLGPQAPLVHAAAGCLLLLLQEESKLLPATVVREALAERVTALEAAEHRKVRKRERERMRDEVVADLLPRAFSRHKRIWGYIDTEAGFLVVDAGSEKQAEHFIEQLREAWGDLQLAPPQTELAPGTVMTRWLAQRQTPSDVELGEEAVLEDPSAEGGEVRLKRQDLTSAEIQAHIEAGKRVRALALTWGERLSGVLDGELALRRLKFLELIREQAGDRDPESEAERLDADFVLMALEVRGLLPRLLEWFGGEQQRARPDAG
ncbi:recombination-associated protein RdgC [Halorhodospira abdelmalekii]|uniref:recombination-associated protein RdgC n=1 Tax=Halorhodospira abdelmalekii TaxID=421629 RepID=UPI0019054CA2|nr:recombination-associated protein RdgC [Halorhodospira abdelmalekii]MBK1735554.1 recombination-associated protein RdgC [Halorhodospira abdelmalekii]